MKTIFRKLKPCPCCGSKAEMCERVECWDGVEYVYRVRCIKCGLMTEKYRTGKWAKEAWNRRADDGTRDSTPD